MYVYIGGAGLQPQQLDERRHRWRRHVVRRRPHLMHFPHCWLHSAGNGVEIETNCTSCATCGSPSAAKSAMSLSKSSPKWHAFAPALVCACVRVCMCV